MYLCRAKQQTSFDQQFLPLSNPYAHKNGFAIKTIQKGGGGPASTRMPAFIVLKTATINKQDIKNNSPNKTFLAEWKSLMELEIINKRPIPKLHAAITSAKPLT